MFSLVMLYTFVLEDLTCVCLSQSNAEESANVSLHPCCVTSDCNRRFYGSMSLKSGGGGTGMVRELDKKKTKCNFAFHPGRSHHLGVTEKSL